MERKEAQFRDFDNELFRKEVDNVFVGLKARTIGPWPSGKTKRSSEVDVDDFQAFQDLQERIVEVVRRAETALPLPQQLAVWRRDAFW